MSGFNDFVVICNQFQATEGSIEDHTIDSICENWRDITAESPSERYRNTGWECAHGTLINRGHDHAVKDTPSSGKIWCKHHLVPLPLHERREQYGVWGMHMG